MDTKYIVIQERGLEQPIIFAASMTHADMARGHKVVSAGFVRIGLDDSNNPRAKTYGESISLKVKSREEDENLVNYILGLR